MSGMVSKTNFRGVCDARTGPLHIMSRWKTLTMDLIKKMPWDPSFKVSSVERDGTQEASPALAETLTIADPPATLPSILRVVHASLEQNPLASAASPPSSQDWTNLIERVRAAAVHARNVEAQAQEQDQRVEELLIRVREDVKRAGDKVRAAEAKAARIEADAELRIRAAEDRAAAAEERASIAEDWLRRVHEVISDEFSSITVGQHKAA